MTQVKTVAVLGTGVIGASWASLFLAAGLRVRAYDPADANGDRLRAYIDESFKAEHCAEYALQPVLERASERLFGVSQIGSGPDEHAQLSQLMADSQVDRALTWLRTAVRLVAEGDTPPPVPDAHPLLP